MSARDRIIAEADAIVLAAGRKVDEAVKDVHRAEVILERHPQFVRSGRRDPMPPADKVNLVTFRYCSLVSVVRDVGLDDAARLLRYEIKNDEKSMEAMIRENQEFEERRLRKLAKAA